MSAWTLYQSGFAGVTERIECTSFSLSLSLIKGIYWNDLQEAVQQIQHWLAVNVKFKNLARCLSCFSVCVGIPKKWVPKPERMDVSARRGQAGKEKNFLSYILPAEGMVQIKGVSSCLRSHIKGVCLLPQRTALEVDSSTSNQA